MRYFLKKTLYVGIAAMLSLGMGSFVHAQTVAITSTPLAGTQLAMSGFPSWIKNLFENHIENDRQNAINNRDERNALLEAKTSDVVVASSSSEDASSTLSDIDSLSLSLSNLENIESRIDARTADEAGQGYDVSAVTIPLKEAVDELDTASSSIVAMYTDPDTFTEESASTTEALVSAKDFMENALDALKTITGSQ